MRMAIHQAQAAASKNEVPVGACLIEERPDGPSTIVALTHNQTHTSGSPLAHAEMLAIEEGSRQLGAWRLLNCTLFVTLEPCPMCAGAVLQSRLKRVVYGAKQPRVGADGSWVNLLRGRQVSEEPESDPWTPHPFHPHIEVTSGVLQEECSLLLVEFFKRRRSERDPVKIPPNNPPNDGE
jgi:tRNA(adenine34) deaminase